MDIGERLARLENAQEWTKIILGLTGAVVIGGFAFLGVQISRLDAKVDAIAAALEARISAESATTRQELNAISARISAESATTRQELIGIATAIANSITAARQMQPQMLPAPTPQQPGHNAPAPKQ